MSEMSWSKGDTIAFEIAVTNPDGTSVDLTGAAMRWTVEGKWDKTIANGGITVTAPATGIAVVTVSSAETNALDVTAYRHECKYSKNGVITTLFKGWLTISESLIGSDV